MMSIFSNSQAQKNNTMTLIKGSAVNRAGLSSIGPNTTIFGEEYLVENGEIEELHYIMVRVEKMKKSMLARVEGRAEAKAKDFINLIDEQEEALYRVGEKGQFDINASGADIGSMIEI